MRPTRRQVLGAGAGALLSGLAGCFAPAPEGPEGTPPDLTCEDDSLASFGRLEQPFDEDDVSVGTLEVGGETAFELSAEGETVSYGSEFRVVLSNRADGERTTGSRHRFSVQRETDAGWRDVRGTPDGSGVTYGSGTETHAPGTAFVWEFDLDEESLADTHPTAELAVCPPLGAGRYRFAYWGLEEGVLAVEFTIPSPV